MRTRHHKLDNMPSHVRVRNAYMSLYYGTLSHDEKTSELFSSSLRDSFLDKDVSFYDDLTPQKLREVTLAAIENTCSELDGGSPPNAATRGVITSQFDKFVRESRNDPYARMFDNYYDFYGEFPDAEAVYYRNAKERERVGYADEQAVIPEDKTASFLRLSPETRVRNAFRDLQAGVETEDVEAGEVVEKSVSKAFVENDLSLDDPYDSEKIRDTMVAAYEIAMVDLGGDLDGGLAGGLTTRQAAEFHFDALVERQQNSNIYPVDMPVIYDDFFENFEDIHGKSVDADVLDSRKERHVGGLGIPLEEQGYNEKEDDGPEF